MNIITAALVYLTLLPPTPQIKQSRKQLARESVRQVVSESKKYDNLSPTLIAAVIYVESGWNAKAVSPKGACGLTQVMPKYTSRKMSGRKYTCKELMDPRISIRVGTRILNYWVNVYGAGDLEVGLCGYSSGFRCKGKHPLKAGQRYARKVLALKKRIENQ